VDQKTGKSKINTKRENIDKTHKKKTPCFCSTKYQNISNKTTSPHTLNHTYEVCDWTFLFLPKK